MRWNMIGLRESAKVQQWERAWLKERKSRIKRQQKEGWDLATELRALITHDKPQCWSCHCHHRSGHSRSDWHLCISQIGCISCLNSLMPYHDKTQVSLKLKWFMSEICNESLVSDFSAISNSFLVSEMRQNHSTLHRWTSKGINEYWTLVQ